MKAWLNFSVVLFATGAALCADAWGADTNKHTAAEKPVLLPSPLPKEPLAPDGQTFNRPATTFSPAVPPQIPVREGTFNRPASTFSTPEGSFNRPETTFSRSTGTFSRVEPTFSTPTGSFSHPGPTFSNPTPATSPLPPGAYGAPIRPPSTFALPPGGTTFSRPTTILPDAAAAPLLQDASVGGIATVQTQPSGTAVSPAPVVIDLPPGATVRKVSPPVGQEKK